MIITTAVSLPARRERPVPGRVRFCSIIEPLKTPSAPASTHVLSYARLSGSVNGGLGPARGELMPSESQSTALSSSFGRRKKKHYERGCSCALYAQQVIKCANVTVTVLMQILSFLEETHDFSTSEHGEMVHYSFPFHAPPLTRTDQPPLFLLGSEWDIFSRASYFEAILRIYTYSRGPPFLFSLLQMASSAPPSGGTAPSPLASVKEWYHNWCASTPFITRSTLHLLPALYALSWVVDLTAYLANIPYMSIYKLQLWRPFLSPFYTEGLLSVLFLCLSLGGMATTLEQVGRRWG